MHDISESCEICRRFELTACPHGKPKSIARICKPCHGVVVAPAAPLPPDEPPTEEDRKRWERGGGARKPNWIRGPSWGKNRG